jgi:hypothetical protein
MRNQFVASVMAANLDELQLAEEALPDSAAATGWVETIDAVEDREEWANTSGFVERWFHGVGGFRSVARAPGLEKLEAVVAGRETGWLSAGLILALIRRMAEHHPKLPGGASVKKAVHIIETVKIPMVIRNSRDLRKAWAKYKPVAHFCAALFDRVVRLAVSSKDDASSDGPLDDVMSFLGEAEAYLNFGTSYAALRSEETLLDPTEVWFIPEDAAIVSTALVSAPLSGELLAAAQSYRAPIPAR